MDNRYSFIGGKQGAWRVVNVQGILGSSLPLVERLNVVNDTTNELPLDSAWILQGFTSNLRYAERNEINVLKSV
ncbi:hypothetical protein [Methyloglobulus sp.]|uniref:hypothetical protein n=1 Tax=Methyloglobulus sp. TaxID=2518622 RepID=UPI003988E2F2